MHQLCLMTLLLLGQTDGPQFDVAPSPLGRFGTGGQQQAGANVGQNVLAPLPDAHRHIPSSDVVPATATELLPLKIESPSGNQPLRLAPKGETNPASQANGRGPPSIGGTIVNIISSLAIVLGLFFLVAWMMRRGTSRSGGALPSDVVQVLGRAQLSPKQQMHLLRVGDKLVLVAITPGGVRTLTEVTDPNEVTRLATACEAASAGSATESFRQVLSQLGNQPAIGGFFGRDEASETSSREVSRA